MHHHDDHEERCGALRCQSGRESSSRQISNEEVFRRLIADEIRCGRLTPARRRRIVRYAAHLNMSAVDVGLMIAQCREEALKSEDPAARHHALKLVEPPPSRMPLAWKLSVVVLLAIIVDLIILLLVE
jgi:hypothetical protein